MAKSEKLESIEKQLWAAANELRKSIDAAEYKHIILGLIFLKYISDSFVTLHAKLEEDKYADEEDPDEYLAENIFFVPIKARWNYLRSRAKSSEIGTDIDNAMDIIEAENPTLKDVLPKVYARDNIDSESLGGLIDKFSNIDMESAKETSGDILGRVFEYCLGNFALDEGKRGGQFYTPPSIVKLLVEMLQPYEGRVFDPCCGSGGMFVQSEKFVKKHQGNVDNISIYGQESNHTTWRLARMNLAIRGIDASNVLWNNSGSFLDDAHPTLKADYIIANPPFNVSSWGGNLLSKNDVRWKDYGKPPEGNANYAWIQHFLYHLTPKGGVAGFILAKGSLTTKTMNEDKIRKKLIEAGVIDCIVSLPAKLFLNTQIPVSMWFIRRGKTKQKNKTLFIDADKLGHLINARTKELRDEDIKKISDTYHNWRNNKGYKDIKGFCNSAKIEKIKKKDYMLSPSAYVELEDEKDDGIPFAKKIDAFKKELEEQFLQSEKLDEIIKSNFSKLKVKKAS